MSQQVVWSSATALNTAQTVSVVGEASVFVSALQGSPITAGGLVFEISDDNVNWYAIQGVRGQSLTVESSYTLVASTNQSWQFDVRGAIMFRVRLNPAITGAGTVGIGISPSPTAAEPAVVIGGAPTGASSTQVQGAGAAGNPPVGNPVLVAGSDGTNLQTMATGSGGQPAISVIQVSNTDGVNNGNMVGLANKGSGGGGFLGIFSYLFAPVGGTPQWDRQRTPNIFKTATATVSGNTALWTPAAGRKFRLMRFRLMVPGNAAFATTAGTVVATLQDAAAATGITTHTVQVPLAAGSVTGAQYASPWIDLGNGFLSSTSNNALNINLVLNGTGAFSGGVIVDACGTEE